MPKIHSEYVCQQCGYKSSSYLGKCPECGSWNSLVETEVSAESERQRISGIQIEGNLVKLSEVKKEHSLRMSTGFSEFDRVLGGGIVPGSLVLISGDPGIGKSTLLLQSAMRISYKSTDHSLQTTAKKKKAVDSRQKAVDNSVLY